MGDKNGFELSPAQKRRSLFEDGRRRAPPSRMRACAECKRHKIKCEPVANETKCAKCLRSGAECVPYNLNQRFLEEDASWKENATAKLSQLRSAVQLLLRHANLPDLEHALAVSPVASLRQAETYSPASTDSSLAHSSMVVPPPMDMTRDSTVELDILEEFGLATVPMNSLYDLTRIRSLSNSSRCDPNSALLGEDFIAKGVVPLAEAEELFRRYMQDIRLYLWAGILSPHETLDAVRRNSTLLTAAMLTVAALHTPGHDEALQKCYKVFVSLTYNTCLSRPQNLDDIRAQALGAFYLSNLSWKLSGLAIRSAVELSLHQSFQKLTRGHEDQRDNVRLWYALYVCEHQCSIAYNRPPTIHEDASIRNIEHFLESPHIKPEDFRLCAQVSLFKILAEAYNTFGSDPDQSLTEADLHQLHFFNVAIEQWRSTWEARASDSRGIGSYPSKGVILHYHFARMHLNSIALRALPPPSAASISTLSPDRRDAANMAISAATRTLTLVFEDPDLRCAMSAVPVFTHTMVAHSANFLLTMVATWRSLAPALDFNVTQVLALARRSADLLAKVAERVNEKHLTSHIVHGINELLEKLEAVGSPGSARMFSTDGFAGECGQSAVPDVAFGMSDLDGFGFGFDGGFMKGGGAANLDFWEAAPEY